MESTVKTILVCDTQPVAIEGVRAKLERSAALRFAGAVSSLDAALELTRTMPPSAIVIDKAFGARPVAEALRTFASRSSPTAAIVWGAGISEAEAVKLLQSGARGVVRRTSDPETLLTCLRAVTSGNTWMEEGIFGIAEPLVSRSRLTPRETEVAKLVEQGMSNRDIARNLGIRTGTVKIHMRHIFEKTGVRGRYTLALNSIRRRGTFAGIPV